jgi:hypothetical protein
LSEQQNPATAPPQYSPDGAWWWNGTQWVPARPEGTRKSGRSVVLVLALVAVAVVAIALLLVVVTRPIGTQVEMDGELDDSYCQMFPEDCS